MSPSRQKPRPSINSLRHRAVLYADANHAVRMIYSAAADVVSFEEWSRTAGAAKMVTFADWQAVQAASSAAAQAAAARAPETERMLRGLGDDVVALFGSIDVFFDKVRWMNLAYRLKHVSDDDSIRLGGLRRERHDVYQGRGGAPPAGPRRQGQSCG